VFFHCDNSSIQFDHKEQTAVEGIVSESLINAKKYAYADVIRVYLHEDRKGIRTLLVEDDGVGFSPAIRSTESPCVMGTDQSEHFGLAIMKERALSIGAVLSIESEHGDGTRVSLKLPPLLAS